GHGAVRLTPECLEGALNGAAVTETDVVNLQRLGNDHVVGALRADVALLHQVAHACVAVAGALLIRYQAVLDAAAQAESGTPERLDGVDLRSDAALHVGDTATVDTPIANLGAPRIDRPAVAGRHHVDMSVKVQHRTLLRAFEPRQHVHARQALAVRSQ